MKKLFLLIFTPLVLSVTLLNIFCNSEKQKSAQENVYLNQNDSVKYVGIDVCKACHYDKYQTFIETGMGQSFGAATLKKSSADFAHHTLIYDKFSDYYYKSYVQNNQLFIMEFRLEGNDTVHKRIEKIDYIVGSGQHTNSHMFNVNGYFYQMPMTFYTQKGKWDLPPGFEHGNNSRFTRAIELECMSCHNAYPNYVQGSKNKFASVLQGIDCERCHGPGELHAKEKAKGIRVDTSKYIDYTIINPKKLSYDLQVDVCQRCHLQGNAVLKEGKTFFDFKPGQKLSDYMNVFLPRYTGGDDQFIMASHADRLKQSKCFIESTRLKINTQNKTYLNSDVVNTNVSSLTCISCHNPHVSVKVTADAQFNNTCKSCHGSPKYTQLTHCTEDLKVRMAVNDNCWKCHMPQTGTIDIPHVTVHDHKIQKPVSKKISQSVKRFIGLAAINNPNPDAHLKGEAYLSYFEKFEAKPTYLDSAEFYLKQKGNYSEQNLFNNFVRLYFLKQDYVSLLRTAETRTLDYSKDPWTLYRIGEAYSKTGNTQRSYEYYKTAVNYAPYNLEFRNKLGGAENALGKFEEAKITYEFILKENPKFVTALSNLGFLYVGESRFEEAAALYDRAIALDPDYEPAQLNKAALLIYQNKKQEGIAILKKILKRNPKNQKVKKILESLS